MSEDVITSGASTADTASTAVSVKVNTELPVEGVGRSSTALTPWLTRVAPFEDGSDMRAVPPLACHDQRDTAVGSLPDRLPDR